MAYSHTFSIYIGITWFFFKWVTSGWPWRTFLYTQLINRRFMPWQCPSVLLSVRTYVPLSVRVSGRFSICFEISIWNLIYTFSEWHDISSLGFITFGSHWPSLQPKVGQTSVLQSWPHKLRYIIQNWYIGDPLYTSRHKYRFFAKIIFSEFLCVLDFSKSPGLFIYIFRYKFETYYIHLVDGVTRRIRVSF